ncbi:hypothetical protein Athai_10910 [Actinocatenispora thailandica]|uniref:DUF3159 domain-containing protein n=1 Tax=Actinocatenispora thailandica TaxID=227318 RepID=A0A7R7HVC0_9ACTN|nr:VC0807 family protein [Actinocatenispora thailandica]BCJ33588.1 hypothetical protein Athai_10910 [Actinocatenispora thailandica]
MSQPTTRTAAPAATAHQPPARHTPGRWAPIGSIALDIVAPLAVLYGLRALGANLWTALVVSSAVPVLVLLVRFARRRVVDLPSLFVLVLIAAGVGISVLTGDPRVLLIRDSWLWLLVGVAGVWLLASVRYGRPGLLVVYRSFVLTKVGPDGLRAWAGRWDTDPGFRHGLRVLTAVWGLATILNAVLHVAAAMVLPLAIAPLVLQLIWPAIIAPLMVFHVLYTKRRDLRA